MIPKPQKHKSRRKKAVEIPPIVKKIVAERDKGICIFCGQAGLPEAHYIRRSHGGLGIEQNIVTLCRICHRNYDSPSNKELSEMIGRSIENHLKSHYPNWNKEDLIYRKENI